MKPIITYRPGGEYSTITLPNGIIETMWFPDDPEQPSRCIGRTLPRDVRRVAADHIADYEITKGLEDD